MSLPTQNSGPVAGDKYFHLKDNSNKTMLERRTEDKLGVNLRDFKNSTHWCTAAGILQFSHVKLILNLFHGDVPASSALMVASNLYPNCCEKTPYVKYFNPIKFIFSSAFSKHFRLSLIALRSNHWKSFNLTVQIWSWTIWQIGAPSNWHYINYLNSNRLNMCDFRMPYN